MPMEKTEDFALGNAASDYCQYCTDTKGDLLPYDKVLAMNAKYYMESQGITADAANKMAANLLKSQPAWKNA
jgi:hypothetical protein